jgi:hypothetical protein
MATEAAAVKSTKFNAKSEWPGYGALIEHTVNALKRNKDFAYVYVGVLTAINLAMYAVDGQRGLYDFGNMTALSFLQLVATLVLTPAAIFYALANTDGKKADWQDFINSGLKKLLPLIGLGILIALCVAVGLVLVILPGLFLIVKLYLSEFVLVDKDAGIVESMNRSFAITKGYFWRTAGAILVALIITGVISGVVSWIPVVGYAVSVFMALATMIFGAHVYRWLDAHSAAAK